MSILFYATACALFGGIFIVRYHLELILFVPFAAGVFAYYLRIGLNPDSPAQNPEKLYRERGFFAYMVVSTAIFVVLMFTPASGTITSMSPWTTARAAKPSTLGAVSPSTASPLWTLGSPSDTK